MNKKVIVAIVLAIVLATTAAFAYPMIRAEMIKKDPVDYLLYASSNSQSKALDLSYEVSVDVEGDILDQMATSSEDPEAMKTFVSSIVSELKYTGRGKVDLDVSDGAIGLQQDLGLNYGENRMLSFNLGYAEGTGFISVPELYNKAFTIEKDDVLKMIEEETGIDFSKIDLSAYIKLLDVSEKDAYKALLDNKAPYEEALRTMLSDLKLGESKTVTTANGTGYNCDTLIWTLDLEKLMKDYIQLLNVVKDDPNAKALAKEVVLDMLNHLKDSGDYKTLEIPEEEIDEAIKEFESGIEREWDDLIDELIDVYGGIDLSEMKEVPGFEDLKYTIEFYVDKNFVIRGYQYSMNMMGVKLTYDFTINATGDAVVVEKPSVENSIDMLAFTEDEALAEEIYNEIMGEHLPAFIKGEAVDNVLKDIEKKAAVLPKAEKDALQMQLDSFVENASMALMFIPNPFETYDFDDDYAYEETDYEAIGKVVGEEAFASFYVPKAFEALPADENAENFIGYKSPDDNGTVMVSRFKDGSDDLKTFLETYAKKLGLEAEAYESYFDSYDAYEIYATSDDFAVTYTLYAFVEDGTTYVVTIAGDDDMWWTLYDLVEYDFNIN